MAGRLENTHVVVTGASSGIGRALAQAFGSEGATVWIGARHTRELAETARLVQDAGGAAHPLQLDVRDPKSIQAFAQAVERGAPGVDTLVNNAGIGAWGRLQDTSLETWRNVIDTNLTGPFLVTKAMLPLLRKRQGRRHVVNIVSVAGKSAYAGGGTYSASKFGLRGWTESIAAELAEEGIRVVAVMPGYVATPLVSKAADAARMIQPADLARTILDWIFLPESVHVDELVVWPWAMYTE